MFKNESGISPVIAEIMLLSITVILAGSAASFVMMVKGPAEEPDISLEVGATGVDNENVKIIIRHLRGESLEVASLSVWAIDNENTAVELKNWDKEVLKTGESAGSTFRFNEVLPGAVTSVTIVHLPSRRVILSTGMMDITGVEENIEISVAVEPEENLGYPGNVLRFTVTLWNRGNVDETFTISAEDDLDWWLSIVGSVTIPAGSSRQENLEVTIPPNAEWGAIDNVTVTVTSQTDPWVVAIDRVKITVGGFLGIDPQFQTGNPGDVLQFTVALWNEGENGETFIFSVADDLGWPTSIVGSVTIPARSSWEGGLTVTIPEDAAEGTVDNVTLTATCQKTQASASGMVRIRVGGFLWIDPQFQTGVACTLPFTVYLWNGRETKDTFALTVGDDLGWQLSLVGSVTIPARSSWEGGLTVTIPEDAAEGAIDNVTVTATSQATGKSATERVQVQVRGEWVKKKTLSVNLTGLDKVGVLTELRSSVQWENVGLQVRIGKDVLLEHTTVSSFYVEYTDEVNVKGYTGTQNFDLYLISGANPPRNAWNRNFEISGCTLPLTGIISNNTEVKVAEGLDWKTLKTLSLDCLDNVKITTELKTDSSSFAAYLRVMVNGVQRHYHTTTSTSYQLASTNLTGLAAAGTTTFDLQLKEQDDPCNRGYYAYNRKFELQYAKIPFPLASNNAEVSD